MASSGVLAFAPDGSRFAYASRAGLMIRSLDQLEPVTVPGGVRGDSPFFSPDGLWLGFTEGARLLKVSLAGGDPIVICESCSGYQFQWGTDDTVRYHTAPPGNLNSRVLMAVPARGGQPRELANPHSSGEAYRAPILLPGTRTVSVRPLHGNEQPARRPRSRNRPHHAVRPTRIQSPMGRCRVRRGGHGGWQSAGGAVRPEAGPADGSGRHHRA